MVLRRASVIRFLLPVVVLLVGVAGSFGSSPRPVTATMQSAGPPAVQAEVQRIVDAVSPDSLRSTLTRLVSFETRHTMSSTEDPNRGIGAARNYILETFRSYGGRLQVDFDRYQVKGDGRGVFRDVGLRNVVAVLPGSHPGGRERILIVGGHYDSSARALEGSDWPRGDSPAPGADDDGSGTAVVMELARVMADYPTEATVMFVAFAGEELGLVGSTLMAQRMAGEGASIEAMITNDIVGSPEGGDGQVDNARVRVFSAGPADSGSRSLARYIRRRAVAYLPSIEVDTIFRYDRFGRGGDHTPFVQEGYYGVRITESHEFYARQHTVEDKLEYVDFDYIAPWRESMRGSGLSCQRPFAAARHQRARVRRLRLHRHRGASQCGGSGLSCQRPFAAARHQRRRSAPARPRREPLRCSPTLGTEPGARHRGLRRGHAEDHVAFLGEVLVGGEQYRARVTRRFHRRLDVRCHGGGPGRSRESGFFLRLSTTAAPHLRGRFPGGRITLTGLTIQYISVHCFSARRTRRRAQGVWGTLWGVTRAFKKDWTTWLAE